MYKAGDKFIVEIDKVFANTTNRGCEKLYHIRGFDREWFLSECIKCVNKYRKEKILSN